jgi:hypothetical protein
MAVSLVSTGVTFPDSSTQTTAATGFGFKNRLINGSMVIDQRNAGASSSNPNSYLLDRWIFSISANSKMSAQQNQGSVTPPTGFSNYLGITSSSAYSISSSDYFFVSQYIEGFNTSDLAFGSASAQAVTVSFWVRSSLTGTFGGSLQNSAQNRNYPFTYTISSANTWEQKTITVAGDTTGTWIGATNGIGLRINFGLGVGSTFSGTAGAWNSNAANWSATGATSVVGTNGATFYITGVQLEKGSTATSFDYRPIGTELQLAQRYYWKRQDTSSSTAFANLACFTSTDARGSISYSQMRSAPTIGFSGSFLVQAVNAIQLTVTSGNMSSNSATDTNFLIIASTSGLTAGQAAVLLRSSGTCFIDASSEL